MIPTTMIRVTTTRVTTTRATTTRITTTRVTTPVGTARRAVRRATRPSTNANQRPPSPKRPPETGHHPSTPGHLGEASLPVHPRLSSLDSRDNTGRDGSPSRPRSGTPVRKHQATPAVTKTPPGSRPPPIPPRTPRRGVPTGSPPAFHRPTRVTTPVGTARRAVRGAARPFTTANPRPPSPERPPEAAHHPSTPGRLGEASAERHARPQTPGHARRHQNAPRKPPTTHPPPDASARRPYRFTPAFHRPTRVTTPVGTARRAVRGAARPSTNTRPRPPSPKRPPEADHHPSTPRTPRRGVPTGSPPPLKLDP